MDFTCVTVGPCGPRWTKLAPATCDVYRAQLLFGIWQLCCAGGAEYPAEPVCVRSGGAEFLIDADSLVDFLIHVPTEGSVFPEGVLGSAVNAGHAWSPACGVVSWRANSYAVFRRADCSHGFRVVTTVPWSSPCIQGDRVHIAWRSGRPGSSWHAVGMPCIC